MKKLLVIMLLVLTSSQLTHAMQTYYEILGVSRKATTDQIKTAYRKLGAQYHPDKTSKLPPVDRLAAENKLKDITDAWDTLKDPQLKSAYDSNWNISDEDTRRRNVADAIARQTKERQSEAETEIKAEAARRAAAEHERMRREKEEAEERVREEERIRKEQERLRREVEERARHQAAEQERLRQEAEERAKAAQPATSRAEAIARARAQRAKINALFRSGNEKK